MGGEGVGGVGSFTYEPPTSSAHPTLANYSLAYTESGIDRWDKSCSNLLITLKFSMQVIIAGYNCRLAIIAG